MKKTNQAYTWGIVFFLTVLLALGGYWVWRYSFVPCCEPPVGNWNAEVQSDHFLTGEWTYSVRDTEGYTTSIDVQINQVDKDVSGQFLASWSFPKAPAARMDNGTFQGDLTQGDPTSATIEWRGDRDDQGRAELRYNKTDDTLEWRGVATGKSDVTMPEQVILHRNRWSKLSSSEQNAIIKVAEAAVKEIPGIDEASVEADITTVVGDTAKVWFVSADGNTTGALTLQQKGTTWVIVPDSVSKE